MNLLPMVNSYDSVSVGDEYIRADGGGYGHTKIRLDSVNSIRLKRASFLRPSTDFRLLQFAVMYVLATLGVDAVGMTVVFLSLPVGLGVLGVVVLIVLLMRLVFAEVVVRTGDSVYRFKQTRSNARELMSQLD